MLTKLSIFIKLLLIYFVLFEDHRHFGYHWAKGNLFFDCLVRIVHNTFGFHLFSLNEIHICLRKLNVWNLRKTALLLNQIDSFLNFWFVVWTIVKLINCFDLFIVTNFLFMISWNCTYFRVFNELTLNDYSWCVFGFVLLWIKIQTKRFFRYHFHIEATI